MKFQTSPIVEMFAIKPLYLGNYNLNSTDEGNQDTCYVLFSVSFLCLK